MEEIQVKDFIFFGDNIVNCQLFFGLNEVKERSYEFFIYICVYDFLYFIGLDLVDIVVIIIRV